MVYSVYLLKTFISHQKSYVTIDPYQIQLKNFYSILVDTANHLSQSIKIKQISVFFICDFMKILLTNLLYIT